MERYVLLYFFHYFEKQCIYVIGIPVFLKHGITQAVKALNDNADFFAG